MKKSTSILLFLVISISASDVVIMPDICQDFLDPQKKKQMLLPVEEGKKGIHVDINSDGTDEKVLLESQGSHSPSLALSIYDKNDKYVRIEEYEDVRFNRSMQIVSYHEHYYIVHYADIYQKFPTYITSINSQNIEKPVCKYKNEKTLKLLAHDDTHNPSKCNALLEYIKEGKTIHFDIPSKFTFEPTKKYRFINKQRTAIGDIGYLDYNNDGKKEYLQRFQDIYNLKLFYRVIRDDKMTLDTEDTTLLGGTKWFTANKTTYSFHGDLESITGRPSIDILGKDINRQVCVYSFDVISSLDNNISKRK